MFPGAGVLEQPNPQVSHLPQRLFGHIGPVCRIGVRPQCRLFADLGQVLKKDDGWLDGLRVSLSVDNVFDARRRVEDEDGVVPDAFQPFRIDPTGRYIGVDLRKAFDACSREGIWAVLRRQGAPDAFVDLLASFHGDTNGLATLPVLAAVHALAQQMPGHRLVFGLDANTWCKP